MMNRGGPIYAVNSKPETTGNVMLPSGAVVMCAFEDLSTARRATEGVKGVRLAKHEELSIGIRQELEEAI